MGSPRTRRPRRWVGAPTLVVAVLILASCGGGNGGSRAASPTVSSTAATTTTTPPTTAPTPSGPSWTITTTQSSGYTANISVQAGTVETYRQASTSAHKPMCGDPTTGGFIPMRVTLTNTTASFPASLILTGTLGTSDTSVSVGPDLSGSTSPCGNAGVNGGVPLAYNNVPAGQSVSDTFYVVLTPYFSPSAPSGNQAAYADTTLELADIGAGPSAIAAIESAATIQGSAHTSAAGPAVVFGSGTLYLSGQCPPSAQQSGCTG